MVSRSPKGEGKAPRVSVSLPDDLKAVIEKEAAGRGITVSKYISDVLTHCHDKDGVNIPAPSTGADLTPLVNMMQQMMSEIQDIKRGMVALPPASVDSASQSSTKEQHYAAPQGDEISTKETVFLWVGHEIPTNNNKEYDALSQRLRRFVKSAGLEGKRIGRDTYYPREPIVQFIQQNPLTSAAPVAVADTKIEPEPEDW